LDSRVVIEQAKGVVAHMHGVDMDAAFRLIRREARSTSTAMPEVAAGIVAGRITLGSPDRS
ncbi:ANTAR domain-containing protein, partial [Clavibacter zhangzhiyongii]|uniref:ANTAR domain-containing protein n=1 Tax=Clavibacter zhangzhiyongii TaxID=2768071 RepID=UPI001958D6CD